MSNLRRRDFLTLLGGAAAAWPLAAHGQEPGRIYRLGCLFTSPRDAPHYLALFDELRRLGFIEGQNLVIDRAAARMSAADLSLNDLAEVVADAIKSSERRILEHVGRMFKLIDVKFGDRHEKTRISNI